MAKRLNTNKRKPGRPRVERVQHIIEIEDWDFDYLFGLGEAKLDHGPYFDCRHLRIRGTVLRPSTKASHAEIVCFPRKELNESEVDTAVQPKAVGYITNRGKDYSANLHLPAEMLVPVLQMLIAKRYRYIVIEASPSFRGESTVRHFTFSSTIGADDTLRRS